jgi:cytochrome c553
MKMRATRALAGLLAASGAALALAQQPPPPPPAFAPSNLSDAGARALAANCGACHGTGGRPAAGSTVPALAGRPAGDLVQVMGQFKSGARPATVMHQIAKGYSDDEIAAIAAYFEKQR